MAQDPNNPLEGEIYFCTNGALVYIGLVGDDQLSFTADESVDPAYSALYTSGSGLGTHHTGDGISGVPPGGGPHE